MNTEDVAYVVALIEKSPSTYHRRQRIIDELQSAWKNSSLNGNPWRIPIMPPMAVSCGVVEIDAC